MSISIKSAKVTQVSGIAQTSYGEAIITVTEWANVEGFDVTVHDGRAAQSMSLTHEEWDAIVACHSVFECGGVSK